MDTFNKDEEDIYSRPIQNHGGSKYLRLIYPADGKGQPIKVDVYEVIEAFNITCPARQHAIKKLLCAGLRGKGSEIDDLKGVFDAMWRALELQKQREVVPQVNEISGIVKEEHDPRLDICVFCKGPCSTGDGDCGCTNPKNYD